ncbi:hypothetical protein [Fluviicola taffensis]|uniref:Uncharacterized protein n=1 Tax=Fluviicola taffensis (strain DSM 16823 / NCIMB 13979 / RW262) TaxID=755732 RepID=F2IK41_FLUTR|nr:hypothetical protein [Fluviicola taffensis]AEA42940.1 hypothetical protein Fluta_0939 [Fluviicola taffensis DSM 16823]
MRALSAIGFVISIIGLLLVCYNQFAVIPFLTDLMSSSEIRVNEFTFTLTQKYEAQLFFMSTLSIIIGVFSVLFCSLVYLRKRTRMTLIGTILGVFVAVMGIIHSWY